MLADRIARSLVIASMCVCFQRYTLSCNPTMSRRSKCNPAQSPRQMAYLGHQFLRNPRDFFPHFTDTYIAYEPIHFRVPRRLPPVRRSQPKCRATGYGSKGDLTWHVHHFKEGYSPCRLASFRCASYCTSPQACRGECE